MQELAIGKGAAAPISGKPVNLSYNKAPPKEKEESKSSYINFPSQQPPKTITEAAARVTGTMGSVAKQFEENGGYPKTLSGNPTSHAYKGRSGLGDFTGNVAHFERPKED